MSVIYDATLTPGKHELISAWLPQQPWCAARAPRLAGAGGFRLDDPDGRVGMEFHAVTDAETGRTYHVPLTYRDAPLEGGQDALITTAEHSVLGTRWIYDGVRDPVLVAQVQAALAGRAPVHSQTVDGALCPDTTVRYDAEPGPAAACLGVEDRAEATELRPENGLVLRVHRVLEPGEDSAALGEISSVWTPPGGTALRGPFLTAHRA